MSKNPAAVALGKIKSPRKAAASRENGKKGGRPKESVRGQFCRSVPCPYDARPLHPGGYCAQCQREYDKAVAETL